MRTTVLLITAALATGCTAANEAATQPPADLGTPPAADLATPRTPVTDGAAANDYGRPGPFGVTQRMVDNGATLYLPDGAGPFPLVVLSSGLLQPGSAYAPYAERLASWGIAAVLRDDPGPLTQTSALVDDLVDLVTHRLAAESELDLGRVGLAGHSRGGQIALVAAGTGLKGRIRGVFTLDPVDGAQGGVSARAQLPAIGVPSAFLGELTDANGGSGGMACAPAADNYQALYALAPSPSVALTAVGADHTQFEDAAACRLCGLCTAGSADGKTVLGYSIKYLTAFFARELLGDAQVGATFAGAGAAADVQSGLIQLTSK